MTGVWSLVSYHTFFFFTFLLCLLPLPSYSSISCGCHSRLFHVLHLPSDEAGNNQNFAFSGLPLLPSVFQSTLGHKCL
ncbi:hypothetical protein J3E72DRAFT_347794 [Bipolaris maydis]|uniref:uncharacterized protein n=1 Tax=Cochliobolus heterostrophus TaxID=5016 RepID=UPI0024D1B14B|nr:hypothetical protein J3E73DRAFT_323650 [Bipolaris maydis]KAJ5057129.1 hypothetical protein J3E74DRAFT_369892 [Bipolaris maydis]KAJ6194341.1 hypothetical protein J3E72DRAFT_347794 [Bipolaris maydis]KAJ6212619.1 hypothetical protein PSV09DRAFT_2289088 [Bipolaris maydis]KAJ6266093.1 hypothetical protein PSV08DRAFT_335017 [Bipolaris maydis]